MTTGFVNSNSTATAAAGLGAVIAEVGMTAASVASSSTAIVVEPAAAAEPVIVVEPVTVAEPAAAAPGVGAGAVVAEVGPMRAVAAARRPGLVAVITTTEGASSAVAVAQPAVRAGGERGCLRWGWAR